MIWLLSILVIVMVVLSAPWPQRRGGGVHRHPTDVRNTRREIARARQ